MSDDKKDARRAKLIDCLSSGQTMEESARTIGVTSRTLRRWCDADPDLAERTADARCRADDEVEAATLANCLDPDPANNTLRMFWLKSRRPEVYREVQQQEHTGGVRVTYVNDWRGNQLTGSETPPA